MAEVALRTRTLGAIAHSVQGEMAIIQHVLNGTDGVLPEDENAPVPAETLEARLDALRGNLDKIFVQIQAIRERIQLVSGDI